jgi:uncharacterized protein (UPF0276 family)
MLIKPDKCLGVGINYRSEIIVDIQKNINSIDFIEINTERFFIDHYHYPLYQIIHSLPVVLHGLTLSVGSDQSISQVYLDNLLHTLNYVNCKWFSEHISATNVNGVEIRSLMPIEFTESRVKIIVQKIKKIMALTNITFLLENITYYYSMPNNSLNEAQFITEILDKSNCGLLLDINNLYVNSINHQYDPYEFIDKLPLERLVEVHLAGCDYIHDMLVDTHASRTKKEVLSLFKYVCQKAYIFGVVIERDDKLENFSELLEEVYLVRNILISNMKTCDDTNKKIQIK